MLFYDKQNKDKCSKCRYWGKGTAAFSDDCTNACFNGRRTRSHSDKACVHFVRRRHDEPGRRVP